MVAESGEANGKPGTTDSDRRLHLRKPLRVNAQLLLAGHPAQIVRTANITLGGMSILALVNLPLRAHCSLLFALPRKGGAAKNIQVEASVLHGIFSDNEGGFIKIGLQFKTLSAEAAQAIQAFLKD